ncbi:hypothetical protein [Streptomyces sp. DH20]|uniref:hypothetical protein n=1 Tax=Streptomyces sp. DH20 TaxID=2857009 RepID=UPI001E5043DA|nr:hypothetical protein [Streptomyces sp. DH20]
MQGLDGSVAADGGEFGRGDLLGIEAGDGVDGFAALASVGLFAASVEAEEGPENLPSRRGGDPDETSFWPIAIQVRRGAEVLGYDPENLTGQQRTTVEESLRGRDRTSSSPPSTWLSSRRRATSPTYPWRK